MVAQETIQELLKTLNKGDREVVQAFIDKVHEDAEFLQNSCIYLADKIGDKQLIEEFEKMSDEIQKNACLEYMILALNSGSVTIKEIAHFIK